MTVKNAIGFFEQAANWTSDPEDISALHPSYISEKSATYIGFFYSETHRTKALVTETYYDPNLDEEVEVEIARSPTLKTYWET